MNNPTPTLTLNLSQTHVQYIIDRLNQLPHFEVRPIIDTIIEQSNAQLTPAPKVDETNT